MKHKKLALFLIIAAFPVIAFTVRAESNIIQNPVQLDVIYPIEDDSAPALLAMAAMYTPVENEEDWSRMVCSGMTEGGCTYFRDNQASAIWKSEAENIGSSSGFIANVETIDEMTQVWKAQVTIFTEANESTYDVFALARRDRDDRWHLDRILSGPGITVE